MLEGGRRTSCREPIVQARSCSGVFVSTNRTLEGYALYLADNKPEVFASLLGRLIPVQANVKHVGSVGATNITINMPLGEMINNFERRIKAACETIDVAAPPLMIDHDTADA
jgi:hypothetical protein